MFDLNRHIFIKYLCEWYLTLMSRTAYNFEAEREKDIYKAYSEK